MKTKTLVNDVAEGGIRGLLRPSLQKSRMKVAKSGESALPPPSQILLIWSRQVGRTAACRRALAARRRDATGLRKSRRLTKRGNSNGPQRSKLITIGERRNVARVMTRSGSEKSPRGKTQRLHRVVVILTILTAAQSVTALRAPRLPAPKGRHDPWIRQARHPRRASLASSRQRAP